MYVNPSTTIGSIKSIVLDRMRIVLNQQYLTFGDEELDEDRTLSDYKIHDGATLNLRSSSTEMQIFVKTLTGKYQL
jgi:hypothetical protein